MSLSTNAISQSVARRNTMQVFLFAVESIYGVLLAATVMINGCYLNGSRPRVATIGEAIGFSEGIAIETCLLLSTSVGFSVIAIAFGRRGVRFMGFCNLLLALLWASILFFGLRAIHSL